MELMTILETPQGWKEYLDSRALIGHLENALLVHQKTTAEGINQMGALRVRLDRTDYQLALDAGLGAVRADKRVNEDQADEADGVVEIGLEKLSKGVDYLGADFHILLGDLMWKH